MAEIVFLHGASSSGKSTLARALQERRAFLHLSFDTYRDSGALRIGPDWRDRRRQVFDGLHQSFAAFAGAGNNLIIEHILDTPGWHAQLQSLLRGHSLLFVGLHTPLAVLETRAQTRDDRPVGSAERDFASIHEGLHYDLELDGTAPVAENLARLLAALENPRHSRFFDAY